MSTQTPAISIHQLTIDDIQLFEAMMTLFGEALEELDTYTAARPETAYVQQLLGSDYFIALTAQIEHEVVGGIAAYELRKFEQQRSEIYIYDLAVAVAHRRKGIATAMLQKLRQLSSARGAYVIFVQADDGDTPAIELYSKLGPRENVLHFDISVPTGLDS